MHAHAIWTGAVVWLMSALVPVPGPVDLSGWLRAGCVWGGGVVALLTLLWWGLPRPARRVRQAARAPA